MLSRLLIDGYKSINRQEFELRNFTLLAGINSAGKSSVLQALLYTVQMQAKQGKAEKKRPYVDLGRLSDVKNSIKGNREILFQLDVCDGGNIDQTEVRITPGENVTSVSITMPSEQIRPNYAKTHNVVYLSVERSGVEKAYDMNLDHPRDIGGRAEYAFAYLASFGQDPLLEEKFSYQPELVGMSMNNQVNYWLGYMMDFHIRTSMVPDVDQVVVTYSNAADNHYYRGRHVGTGITYIAMLIIAALTCKQGDALIIENPEIHLHPRAQSKFMEFLAYLSERGLQIILETHSDHIYNGMRKCIKKGRLSREKTAVYFLELDDTMQTKVCRIQLNEQGAEENHPYGMFDQFDDDLDELLEM